MKRNHYGRNRRYEDASTVRDTNVNITDTGTESTLGIWSSSHCCKSGFAVKLKISGINPTCVQSSKPVPAGMAMSHVRDQHGGPGHSALEGKM